MPGAAGGCGLIGGVRAQGRGGDRGRVGSEGFARDGQADQQQRDDRAPDGSTVTSHRPDLHLGRLFCARPLWVTLGAIRMRHKDDLRLARSGVGPETVDKSTTWLDDLWTSGIELRRIAGRRFVVGQPMVRGGPKGSTPLRPGSTSMDASATCLKAEWG